jgi:hypothetical protein
MPEAPTAEQTLATGRRRFCICLTRGGLLSNRARGIAGEAPVARGRR